MPRLKSSSHDSCGVAGKQAVNQRIGPVSRQIRKSYSAGTLAPCRLHNTTGAQLRRLSRGRRLTFRYESPLRNPSKCARAWSAAGSRLATCSFTPNDLMI